MVGDSMIDYTLVVGVDAKHLKQLEMVWPTWAKHKPDLLKRPMVVFFDYTQTSRMRVKAAIDHPDLRIVEWPPTDAKYPADESIGRFGNAQRFKMLSGFVHATARFVDTEYWLKLDTDVVATGMPEWIDEEWFGGQPAIVAHPWSFTKPPNQMLLLDQWAKECKMGGDPLNLIPEPGSDRLSHKRIISWCGFFHSGFTDFCSEWANFGTDKIEWNLPVPSQDGYMWYMAKRNEFKIVRQQMKNRGWEHWSTEANIRKAIERAMA